MSPDPDAPTAAAPVVRLLWAGLRGCAKIRSVERRFYGPACGGCANICSVERRNGGVRGFAAAIYGAIAIAASVLPNSARSLAAATANMAP